MATFAIFTDDYSRNNIIFQMKDNEIIIRNLFKKDILEILKKHGIDLDNEITEDFKQLIDKIHFREIV